MLVALIGVAGPNLGDSAIALAVDSEVRRAGASLTVVHPGAGHGTLEGLSEQAFNRRKLGDWFRLYRLIRNADLSLIGGGSLIQDKLGLSLIRGMLPHVLQVTMFSVICGRRPSFLCIGVDRLYTTRGKRIAAFIMRRLANRIIVRDKNSWRRARVLSGSVEKLSLCPDPAFSFASTGQCKDSAAVTIVPTRHDLDWQEAGRLFSEVLDASGQTGKQVNMVLSDVGEEEQRYADAVARRLREDGYVVSTIIPETVEECVAAVTAAPLMFSMRLHPIIFAFESTQCIALSDNSKITSLARDVGIQRISPAKWKKGIRPNLDVEEIDMKSVAGRAALKAKYAGEVSSTLGELL